MKTVYLLTSLSFCVFIYLVYSATDNYYLEENYYVVKEMSAEKIFKNGAYSEGIVPRITPIDKDGYGMKDYLGFGITGFLYSDSENYRNEDNETVTRNQIVRITGEGIRNVDGWITTMVGKKQEGVAPVIEIEGKRYITLESQFKYGYLLEI